MVKPILPRQWLAAAFAVVLQIIVAACASATTYYVAPTGNDSNSGTQGFPFREIRRAIAASIPGDTILVADGSYMGFDIWDYPATAASPLTIRASGANAQVLPTTDRSDNRDTIFVTYSDHIIIDGLRSFQANRAAVRLDHSNSITIRNCVFGKNGTWGIFTNNSDDSLFEDNECYGSVSQHGIYVSNSSMRPVVRGNRLHDNAQCGLQMNGDLSMGAPGIIDGAVIERNAIWGNGSTGGAGINLDGPQNSVVRNNLLYGNLAGGITTYRIDAGDGPRNVQILHNTIAMPSAGRWAVLVKQSAGLVTLRNNILLHANAAKGGLLLGDAADTANTDSDHNILDRVTPDDGATLYSLAQWQSLGRDLHSLSATADSLFLNAAAADYHLRSASPAIDSGVSAGVAFDLEGNGRPVGAGYDIGCYEAAASPPPALYTLSASPTIVQSGQTIIITWTAPVGSSSRDWVGLYKAGSIDSGYLWWVYTQGVTSASAAVAAPNIPGEYEFRYFLDNGFTRKAISNRVVVEAGYALSATPTTVDPGGRVDVCWTAGPDRTAVDWIGLFRKGASNREYIRWIYTAAAAGSASFEMPAEAGEYEFRYLFNNGYTDLRATSNAVIVSAASGTYFLSASPSSVSVGGAVTVTWNVPAGAGVRDWIGLFRVGDPNTSYLPNWIYTKGATTGSHVFTMPSTAGQYEFRYLLNNGFTMTYKSSIVTVN